MANATVHWRIRAVGQHQADLASRGRIGRSWWQPCVISFFSFRNKLIKIFLADSEALLDKMRASIAGRTFTQYRNHLHAMKGSAASMGLERLGRLCTEQRKLSDAELSLQSPVLIKTLEAELTAGREVLERRLADKRESAV